MNGKITGYLQGSALQTTKQFGPIRGIPGRQSRHHFVHQHPQSPIVHAKSMTRLGQNLGGHVLGSPAHGGGPLAGMSDSRLGQSKVPQFDVTIGIQQHILRFQITVYNASLMQMTNGQQQLGRIETGHAFGKTTKSRQMEKQLATGTIIQHQIQLIGCLKGIMQFHNKGMIHHRQHLAFCTSPFNLPSLDQMRLSKNLHGKQGPPLLALPFLNQNNLSKRSLPEDSKQRQKMLYIGFLIDVLLLLYWTCARTRIPFNTFIQCLLLWLLRKRSLL
mmetsp:Transcript_17380/g.40346  ORF Transcript_17380/g.40346 Transcript_17380/m.40346 type:complete len:274 (-) Transcript_17380:84-905(-)